MKPNSLFNADYYKKIDLAIFNHFDTLDRGVNRHINLFKKNKKIINKYKNFFKHRL